MRWMVITILLVLATPSYAQGTASDIRKAHGDWSKLETIKFSWTVVPRDVTRSYDWDVRAGLVTVKIGEDSIRIPVNGVGLSGEREVDAHKAFINDSYWLLFEQFIFRDKVAMTSDTGPVPGTDMVTRRLRVAYASGGYTPGDAYRLYVGEDGKVFGWEYFPGGGTEPRFFMTRQGHITQSGVTVPTEFRQNGEVFIRLEGVDLR